MESLLELFKDHVYSQSSYYDLSAQQFPNLAYLSAPPAVKTSTKFNFTKPGTLAQIDEQAKLLHTPIIDYNVFFILDTSTEALPFNSYVFYIDGKIVKTEKTTRQLLQIYMEQRNLNYEWLKMMGSMVGVYQKVPIVYANCFFAPVGGPSKRPTDWYGIHHLMHTERIATGTLLSFSGFTELVVPQSKELVEKMIERTDRLERINTQVVLQAVQEILYCKKEKSCSNVIKQRRTRYQNELHVPSAEELRKEFIHRQAAELLREMYGEDALLEKDLERVIKSKRNSSY